MKTNERWALSMLILSLCIIVTSTNWVVGLVGTGIFVSSFYLFVWGNLGKKNGKTHEGGG